MKTRGELLAEINQLEVEEKNKIAEEKATKDKELVKDLVTSYMQQLEDNIRPDNKSKQVLLKGKTEQERTALWNVERKAYSLGYDTHMYTDTVLNTVTDFGNKVLKRGETITVLKVSW